MKCISQIPGNSRHILSTITRRVETHAHYHSSSTSNLARVRNTSQAFNPSLFFSKPARAAKMSAEMKDGEGNSRVGSTISVESMQVGTKSTISGPSGVSAQVGGQANVQRLAKISRDFRSKSNDRALPYGELTS
jgi:hypothetical protein